jgi:hypothetical protein
MDKKQRGADDPIDPVPLPTLSLVRGASQETEGFQAVHAIIHATPPRISIGAMPLIQEPVLIR